MLGEIKTIEIGIPSIDKILSRPGGLPLGHMIEVFGPEGSGKSSFALIAAASVQKQGGKVGYIDLEGLSLDLAELLGVNIDELDLRIPECGEEALETVREMCNDGYGLVIIDSVPGLVSSEAQEKELGNIRIGDVARLLAQFLPKFRLDILHQQTTCVIWINQMRANIKTGGFGFVNPEKTFGGWTLKHEVSIRLEIRKVSWLKYSTSVVGFKSRLRAIKNKCTVPHRDAYLYVTFDPDAPDVGYKKMMLEEGLMEKKGSRYLYKGKTYTDREIYKVIQDIKNGK